jgi:hypothetical protein
MTLISLKLSAPASGPETYVFQRIHNTSLSVPIPTSGTTDKTWLREGRCSMLVQLCLHLRGTPWRNARVAHIKFKAFMRITGLVLPNEQWAELQSSSARGHHGQRSVPVPRFELSHPISSHSLNRMKNRRSRWALGKHVPWGRERNPRPMSVNADTVGPFTFFFPSKFTVYSTVE